MITYILFWIYSETIGLLSVYLELSVIVDLSMIYQKRDLESEKFAGRAWVIIWPDESAFA